MFLFAVKTLGYAFIPFAFPRVRRARAEKRKTVEAERNPVLTRHNSKMGWQADTTGPFRFRTYADYSEYLTHQTQKYLEILDQGGLPVRAIVYYRLKFFDRFRRVTRLIPRGAKIVCAGARDGTEVEVWRDLGFYRAIGIDVNPGPDNFFVRQGDFNHMPFDDASVDLIYSNCLDHSFDFKLFFA